MSTTTPEELYFDLSSERIAELAALVDAAAADAKRGWYEISSALTAMPGTADVSALAVAFDYRLQDRDKGNNNPVFHAAHLTPVRRAATVSRGPVGEPCERSHVGVGSCAPA
ncbi:hypothetical protein [Amycolatopsis camponoti]|uniref:hypothetical protein n=1 Tax=Amycolatopsis camponoti TaxID=2606593 RepID=UPI0012D8111B|nr:hypothetical protein [Amycolatopsis camponoti]